MQLTQLDLMCKDSDTTVSWEPWTTPGWPPALFSDLPRLSPGRAGQTSVGCAWAGRPRSPWSVAEPSGVAQAALLVERRTLSDTKPRGG